MPRDLPDWNALSAQRTVGEVTDLGELAVRQGSIVSYDRFGDVVFLDDFENGLARWAGDTSGAGAAGAISTAEARNGTSSVLLTAGSDLGRHATITHVNSAPFGSQFAFELSWHQLGTIESIQVSMFVYDGVNIRTYQIVWDDDTDVLQYLDSNGSLITFATGVSPRGFASLFRTMKLVVDEQLQQYVRLQVDNVVYSLGGIAAREQLSTIVPIISMRVRLDGRSGVNDIVYVDDVILTQNEPI